MVVTVTTFKIKRPLPADPKNPNQATRFHHVKEMFCFVDQTDLHIYESLFGYDREFSLMAVIRLEDPMNCIWDPESEKVNNTTVVNYSVMNMPYTEVYHFKSDKGILADINARDFQSYHINTVVHAADHRFDALSTIMKFKDSN